MNQKQPAARLLQPHRRRPTRIGLVSGFVSDPALCVAHRAADIRAAASLLGIEHRQVVLS